METVVYIVYIVYIEQNFWIFINVFNASGIIHKETIEIYSV